MISPQQLTDKFDLNIRILQMQIQGLTHADSLLQPPLRGNCLNWVLGHIAVNRDEVLSALGETPLLSKEERGRYQVESDPVMVYSEGIIPLERLMALLLETQERINALLPELTLEDWVREIPSGERVVPLSQHIFSLYFHETYHTGQTELLRQLAGTDDKVI